jgi:predicted transcriptional regulator
MVSFGKKPRECREAKGFSQQELAKKLGSAHTVIGRYELMRYCFPLMWLENWRMPWIQLLAFY